MRHIPAPMAAALADGVTTHAHVWRIVRRDGVHFAFSDHDRRMMFDELVCEPLTAFGAGAIEKSLGLGVDTASVSGVLDAEAITDEDVRRGLWDGARVDMFKVDWSAPANRVHLFGGSIGEVRSGSHAFEAELRGLQAALNVPVGRVFSRFCDADFGDLRCGIDANAPAFRGEGIVLEALSAGAFRVSGLEAFEPGWFVRGRLLWNDGGGGEVATHATQAGVAILELLDSPAFQTPLGSGFVILAGCDKRFETCRGRFANGVNFRGFPHMPGNDAIQAGPVAGDALDGRSRYR